MNPPNLRLSIITESDQLESLRPAWSDLLARSASNEPMLSPLWLATWWRIYGPATGRQLRIGLFFDGQRLVGLAPLCRRVYWYHRCIPFRRIEFLGADAEESDGVCSEYLNVIAERGLEEAVAQALASSLAGRAFGPWDEVVLSALDGDHAMSAVLIDAFRERGTGKRERGTGNRERGIFCSLFPSLERLTMAESPYIPLPASWEAYLAGLHQDQRYFIKRSMRDFEAWAGPDWQVHDVTAPAELAEGMRILTSLHTGRWSAENQAGAFQAPRFAAFHEAVAAQLLQEHALELLWLSVRGEPIAAWYNMVWQNKVYFYQTGRKLDLPSEIRPGVALLVHVLRRAIEAGRREFDFLGGVSQYKMKFATNKRPIVQVRLARLSAVEIVRRLAEHAVRWFRSKRH